MSINIEYEYELNRAWIIDDETKETVGETNFVVPAKWLNDLFNEKYSNEYEDLEEFTDIYEPEVDGEFIYQKAIEDGVLKEDLGITMY